MHNTSSIAFPLESNKMTRLKKMTPIIYSSQVFGTHAKKRFLFFCGVQAMAGIEDASARPPHPKMAGPADGVAQSVLGVYA